MIVWEANEINIEQEKALLEKGSVLLIACPGSGKTRCIIYKIAQALLYLESSRKYIVAITYTNAAANEIKDRVELLGISTTQLWIGTIHAFCLEWILRPYHHYLKDLETGFRVISSQNSEDLINDICTDRGNGLNHYDCNYYATPEGYRLTSLNNNKHEEANNVLAKYFEILNENDQIDYELILYYAQNILKERKIVSDILSEMFPLMLVDEYQDTKRIQYDIVLSIVKAGKRKTKLFIVGDPNQSIYYSLGGYAMPKNRIEKKIGFELTRRNLSINYRSSKAIIDYYNYFKTEDTAIEPGGKYTGYSSKITYNPLVAKENIVREIKRIILLNINEYGIDPNEICIAGPQWPPLASLTRALMVELPELNFDGPGMAPFSRDLGNFWYKFSRIILTEASPDLYVRRLRWASEIIEELTFSGIVLKDMNARSLLKLCNSISSDEIDGLYFLRDKFVKICKALNVEIGNSDLLQEHFESFFSSAKKRIDRLVKEGNPAISTVQNFRNVFKQKNGIKISTIHGTKGLEFDTVIGFGLVNNWVPHFTDQNGEENSKKMLYVLCSRARKNLHLISESGRSVNRFNPEGNSPTPYLFGYNFKYSSL